MTTTTDDAPNPLLAIPTAPDQSNPATGETKAGNYFVSNYPPYSFWSPDNRTEALAAMERPPKPGNPLGLYVHIPFCRKRCHFCYFKVITGARAQEIRTYIDGATRELDMYMEKPFIGGRTPDFVYFGGGTPSFLNTRLLTEFTDALKERLPWDNAREVAFEAEPGTLTEKKIHHIRSLGVTRLSLGVENFDSHILELNGRAHRAEEVYKAYQTARDAGFPQINIDLIAGMLDETDDNWKRNIEETLKLQPDSVTIYQMEIPFNTTIYQNMSAAGKLTAPVADWETKRRWVDEAFAELEKNGYRIGSAYTAVRDDKPVDFLYRDLLWEGADLLSIGVASFGHINGTHYQNQHKVDEYLAQLDGGNFPIYRALTPDADELLIREFILQLKLGHLDLPYFDEKFGVNTRERFAAPLQTIADWGYFARNDTRLELTRDGLLEVDRLLHEFFLPQHQNKRYA